MHSYEESQLYTRKKRRDLEDEFAERLSPSRSANVDSTLDITQDSFFSQDEFYSAETEHESRHLLQHSPDQPRSEGNDSPLEYMSALGSTASVDHLRYGGPSHVVPRNFTTPPSEFTTLDNDDNHHGDGELASSQYHDSSPIPEDMMESKIYSHEEAESMYQSAITHASFLDASIPECRDGLDYRVEGLPSKDPSLVAAPGERSGSTSNLFEEKVPDSSITEPEYQAVPVSGLAGAARGDVAETEEAFDSEAHASVANLRDRDQLDLIEDGSKPAAPESQESLNVAPLMVKNFFSIDSVVIQLPEETTTNDAGQDHAPESAQQEESTMIQIPGGFSQSTMISTHRLPDLQRERTQRPKLESKAATKPIERNRPISISIDEVSISSDMSLTRMAILAVQQLPTATPKPSKETAEETAKLPFSISLHVKSIEWVFLALLRGRFYDTSQSPKPSASSAPASPDILLVTQVEGFSLSHIQSGMSSKRDITIGKFVFGYEDEPIISFDSSLKMRESVRDVLAPIGQDIKISTTGSHSGVSDVTIMTLPLHVKLDLTRLDETFSWFGGLSGMLELGNSMMSTVTITESKSRLSNTPEKSRAVRFEPQGTKVETPVTNVSNGQPKITARVGGILLDVRGRNASINIEGTAVKVVSRAGGVRVRIDKIRFAGPILDNLHPLPAFTTKLEAVRLEYLPLPTDDDLDRLLALLAPSHDRDDSEDDILLETFLRQRRQGGVLRLDVEMAKSSVVRLHELSQLATMSEELKKLSTVAKYLPDDDRPGILTLGHIENINLEVELNGGLGIGQIQSRGVEIAQVTLPSLLLLGLGSLGVQHNGQELIGEAIPYAHSMTAVPKINGSKPPAVMARFIGDELEPTLKIKLWNLRFEYHISTLMTILGITETASGEIVVADMVSSMATLTAQRSLPRSSTQSSASSTRSTTSKLLKFDISIRETVIGLNPRGSTARGLVVFTKAKLLGTFPRMDDLDLGGSLEISKMSFLIIDNVSDIESLKEPMSRSVIAISERDRDQIETLEAMGYVSVSEISSAKVNLQMTAPEKGAERSLEIDISDDLFVLETCADSTQTLQAILNGLKPPMPPSTELKYRTEVIPLQDMLASLTGDAFEAEAADVDDTDYAAAISESEFMDDGGPLNLDFVSNFYSPSPGDGAGKIDRPPFRPDTSAPGSPVLSQKSARQPLLSSFRERTEMAEGSGPLSFNEEHFGSSAATGGTTQKWNSNRNAYDSMNEPGVKGSPFRMRLRDVHIIWNLFDGYDWQRTREAISQAVAEVEIKAAEKQARRGKRMSLEVEDDEDSVIGDFLFNSIYIGVGNNQNPRDLARQINRNIDDMVSESGSYTTTTATSASESPSRQGAPKTRRSRLRLQRSKHHKMTFELKGVSVDVIVFPPKSGETQSSTDIRVKDLEIFDHVPTSTWKKFATYMHDAGERESGTSMIHIEILNVRPIPELAASEMILRATVLPLRLHVDQDALDFMTRFFEFRDELAPATPAPSEVPFIQRAEVNAVPVKLDFKPKRVDYAGLRSGRTTEFMNFIVLDGADMVLRHVIIYGVSGFDKLGKTLNDVWMPDIKRNQLPGVLAGLAPVRSLVNVGSGVRDLVVIPMREYRKDGRVIRSIQKGALAFAKTTTTELARLGAKLAVGTQTVLQNAEGALAPRPASSSSATGRNSDFGYNDSDTDEIPEERAIISPYADPPVGVLQGLRGAYRHLERDLLLAKDAIVAMPGEIMDSGSPAGAARAVLRGAPTVVLRPALGVTKAVGQTLMGATNALDKGERRRIEDKYKRR